MATIEDVYKRCETILQKLAAIEQRCEDRCKILEGHQKTLYGEDGAGGIVARVNNLNGINTTQREWVMRIGSSVAAALIVSAIFGGLILWKIH